jgi:serine/threonine protein kinase
MLSSALRALIRPNQPPPLQPPDAGAAAWQSVWAGVLRTDTYVTPLVNRKNRRKGVKMKVLYTDQEGYYFLKHAQMEGGFGRFYVGHVMGTGEQVGVKVVALRPPKNPRKRSTIPEDLAAVRAEVDAMVFAGSRAGPICFGVNPQGTKAYIVQHLLFGDANNMMDALLALPAPQQGLVGTRPPPNIVGRFLLGQIAESLAALHKKNLLHRDVKPGNLLFDRRQGTLHVNDFGTACAGPEASGSVGTPFFRAFEQLDERQPESRIGTPADVQAMALTVIMSLTREAVFFTNHAALKCGKVSPSTLDKFCRYWTLQNERSDLSSELESDPEYEHFAEVQKKLQKIDADLADLLLQLLNPDPAARPSARDVARHKAVYMSERKQQIMNDAISHLPSFNPHAKCYLELSGNEMNRLVQQGYFERLSATTQWGGAATVRSALGAGGGAARLPR